MNNAIEYLAKRGYTVLEVTEENELHTYFTAKRKRGVQHFRYTPANNGGCLLKRNTRGLYDHIAVIR